MKERSGICGNVQTVKMRSVSVQTFMLIGESPTVVHANAIMNMFTRRLTMAKYYVNCGSVKVIYDMGPKGKHMDAAVRAFLDTNKDDKLDNYMIVSEQGFRDQFDMMPVHDMAYSITKVQRVAEKRQRKK
jgi:hypothetical protein